MDETTKDAGAGGATPTADEAGAADASAAPVITQARNMTQPPARSAMAITRCARSEDIDVGAITDQVRTYVRSNPGKALLISVGVGFLIGLLLRRDEE